ncbi:MAG: apolipoprotein N-acyltransferase [Alphaproteobacteria bacterium]|nr:apolipoprotein N-acyltransferase [Alphaproteobacteria bacterium]
MIQTLKKITSYPKILLFLAGGISTFALPPYYHIWVLFFTFGLLNFFLQNTISYKQSFIFGYCFGFGFFSVGLSWLANALALDIVSFGWLIPIALGASGAFFGLFFGGPALISHYFKNVYSKIIIFAVSVAFFEWIRSFLLTGFPWNLLGSAFAFNHLWLQFASIFGTYGLSIFLIMIAMFPSTMLFIPYKKNAFIGIGLSLLIILTMFIFGFYRTTKIDNDNKSDISIRIVQPSIPQNLKWNKEDLEQNFADYIELSQANGFETADVVIWGETASTFPLALNSSRMYQVLPAIPDDGFLITGSIDYFPVGDDWQPVNAGLVFQHGKGLIANYAKSHLVPFGEYIPFRRYLPESLRPITGFISDFKKGSGVQTFSTDKLPPFGLLICYEIIFPSEVVDKNNRPQWLINLTNDGWYGKSSGPYQHLVSAQLRAVEEGITIVRAANSGVSAIISRSGKILNQIGLHKRGNLDAFLPEELEIITPYSKHNNLYFFILSLLLVVFAVFVPKMLR